MSGPAHPRVTSVALLVVKETTPGTLYALYEVLGSAGVAWPAVTGQRTDAPRLDLRIVSADGKPLAGVMGVPITFLDKYNPDQFEIVGSDYDVKEGRLPEIVRQEWTGKLDRGYLKGKRIYARLLIRHRRTPAKGKTT